MDSCVAFKLLGPIFIPPSCSSVLPSHRRDLPSRAWHFSSWVHTSATTSAGRLTIPKKSAGLSPARMRRPSLPWKTVRAAPVQHRVNIWCRQNLNTLVASRVHARVAPSLGQLNLVLVKAGASSCLLRFHLSLSKSKLCPGKKVHPPVSKVRICWEHPGVAGPNRPGSAKASCDADVYSIPAFLPDFLTFCLTSAFLATVLHPMTALLRSLQVFFLIELHQKLLWFQFKVFHLEAWAGRRAYGLRLIASIPFTVISWCSLAGFQWTLNSAAWHPIPRTPNALRQTF